MTRSPSSLPWTSRVFVATLALSLAALAGCDRMPTAPETLAPGAARHDATTQSDPPDAPDAVNLTLGADSHNGGQAGIDVGYFPYWTVVDVEASGVIELIWAPPSGFSGQAGGLDPGGRRLGYYNNICSGYGDVYLASGTAYGSFIAWDACSALGTNFKSRLALKDYISVGRSVDSYVALYNPPQHACGYAWLGWPGDCVTYSGTQSFSLKRLDAQLGVTADSTSVHAGSTVHFRAAADPLLFDANFAVPLAVLRWRWVPDETPAEGTPLTKACGATEFCAAEMLQSGTMYADAVVNGKKLSKGIHVQVKKGEHVKLKAPSGMIVPSEIIGIGSPDSSKSTISVSVLDADNKPVPNKDVTLVLKAHEGTGGHAHSSTSNPKNPGKLRSDGPFQEELTVNTGAGGTVNVRYLAPDAAGEVTLTGTSPGAESDKAELVIGRTGLSVVAEIPGKLEHVGAADGHDTRDHPERHYATAALSDLLTRLADTLYSKFSVSLGVNDISLPLGGQFDDKGDWAPPHRDHRRGWGADIRTTDKTEKQRRFMFAVWEEQYDGAVFDETGGSNPQATGPHYHFKQCATCSR